MIKEINGLKIDQNLNEVVGVTNKKLTSIELPEGVTSIGERAFSYCSSLTSIELPEGVTSIGDSAFSYCSSLTSIELPEGVTSIGERAFEYCDSLTSIELPEGVTSIGEWAFSYCDSLTSITLPEGVTSIGDSAFEYCDSLTSITMPEIAIPYMVKNIKEDTKVTIYNSKTINGIIYSEDGTRLLLCKDRSLTSIVLPEGVTSIGDSAFYNCDSLTSITLPEGVTSIGDSAFSYCSSLTSITLPEGVTSIWDSAFYECDSLTSITLPEGVTSIGKYAFFSCRFLTSITLPEGLTSIGNQALPSKVKICSIREEVSKESATYKTYMNYDENFGNNEAFEDKIEYCVNRLSSPAYLSEENKEVLSKYVRKYKTKVLKGRIEKGDLKEIATFKELGMIDKKSVSGLITYANEKEKIEIVSYLMNVKYELSQKK